MTRVTINFDTVPDELLETAKLAHNYLEIEGYSIDVEPLELGYPNMPTFRCTNGAETLIVEVADSVPIDTLKQWSAYGRSCSRETRAALVIPNTESVSGDEIAEVSKIGVGIYIASSDEWREIAIPTDLAINLQLPALQSYSNRVRRTLGPAFREIRRGQWQGGFAAACEALAHEAKAYLSQEINKGRITLKNPSGADVTSTTLSRLNRMTLGQVQDAFDKIDSPNQIDQRILGSLSRLNPDRILAAHRQGIPQDELVLRTNVGNGIWIVTAAMKEIATVIN